MEESSDSSNDIYEDSDFWGKDLTLAELEKEVEQEELERKERAKIELDKEVAEKEPAEPRGKKLIAKEKKLIAKEKKLIVKEKKLKPKVEVKEKKAPIEKPKIYPPKAPSQTRLKDALEILEEKGVGETLYYIRLQLADTNAEGEEVKVLKKIPVLKETIKVEEKPVTEKTAGKDTEFNALFTTIYRKLRVKTIVNGVEKEEEMVLIEEIYSFPSNLYRVLGTNSRRTLKLIRIIEEEDGEAVEEEVKIFNPEESEVKQEVEMKKTEKVKKRKKPKLTKRQRLEKKMGKKEYAKMVEKKKEKAFLTKSLGKLLHKQHKLEKENLELRASASKSVKKMTSLVRGKVRADIPGLDKTYQRKLVELKEKKRLKTFTKVMHSQLRDLKKLKEKAEGRVKKKLDELLDVLDFFVQRVQQGKVTFGRGKKAIEEITAIQTRMKNSVDELRVNLDNVVRGLKRSLKIRKYFRFKQLALVEYERQRLESLYLSKLLLEKKTRLERMKERAIRKTSNLAAITEKRKALEAATALELPKLDKLNSEFAEANSNLLKTKESSERLKKEVDRMRKEAGVYVYPKLADHYSLLRDEIGGLEDKFKTLQVEYKEKRVLYEETKKQYYERKRNRSTPSKQK